MDLIPLWYWLICFFVLGACVGSFYNVIVYRMPRGISLINPPSHCPLCKKHIPLYLNMPIVGWLILRGKSACCKQPISVIYPIGESLCGLLGALALLLAAIFNYGGFPLELLSAPVLDATVWEVALALFWLFLGIYPVCAVDFKYKLIPDSISVGGIFVGFALSFFPGGITPLQSLIGAITAGTSLWLFGFIIGKILKKEAMGFGDVKLLAGYGAFMGFAPALATLIIASFLGLMVMVPFNMFKKKDENGQIPFGPFLAISAPIMYLFGNRLIELYLAQFSLVQ
ncbi:MAG: prepilin peptidase [Fibrobacter sp.]|nr:prepilin peptidase [Fibrobacter sp.]